MIEAPWITRTDAQQIALVRLTVPRQEIQNVMLGRAELMGAAASPGIIPAGPWFTHHLSIPSDCFDFGICARVNAAVTATGRVQPGRLRAAVP
ncbi:MAG: hypothetical protein ACRERV_01630 [Methylococcales bacterium]